MKRGLLFALILVVAAALAAKLLVFEILTIAGADMAPTLLPEESYLVYRLDRHIRRGDLVLFDVPGSSASTSVRRVIGLPGDTIEYRGQRIYVGGKAATGEPLPSQRVDVGPLERTLELERETLPGAPSPYRIARDPARRSKDQPSLKVPSESYYVLADNRNHGRDSREYGVVPASHIRGKIIKKVLSLTSYAPVE